MKQLPCPNTMSANKPWAPEQEGEESGTEVMSGDLYLLSSGDMATSISSSSTPGNKRRASRHPVHVKIYRSSFDHYAVLTASLRAPATYLNLRTCNCRPWAGPRSSLGSSSPSSSSTTSSSSSSASAGCASRVTCFRVELGGGEGQVMYFEVGGRDQGGVEEWVRAFQGVMVPTPGTISPSLSPVIPRNPIMPMLQESVEEEEEEEEISGLA